VKDESQILSESLNAYLDGELDSEMTVRLERRVAADSRLQRHLNELEQVRALSRAAYAPIEEKTSPSGRHFSRRQMVGYGLAAALLVGVGIGIDRWQRLEIPEDSLLASLPSYAQVIQPAHLKENALTSEQRAIFHVTSANPQSARSTLEHVEQLLRRYNSAGKSLRVEIVANAEGLDTLRVETTPVREQIARLHKDYPNIAFLACGTTIARMKREQGIDVKLLPQVAVTSSALNQILSRLHQGWVYIRI
jgi:intracellular sulfur oxidation DsrE/DsrF family protein